MKKIIQKFLVTILTMSILTSVIVMPSFAEIAISAEPEVTLYKNDFNSLGNYIESGYTSKVPGISTSKLLYPDITDASSNLSTDTSSNADNRQPYQIIVRDEASADLAFRLYTAQEYTNANNLQGDVWTSSKIAASSGEIIRFSIDMLAEDMAADKVFNFRNSNKEMRNIINLSTDGMIKVWGQDYKAYTVNTWYNFDLYYDCDTNTIYFYENDVLVKIIRDTKYVSELATGTSYIQFISKVPAKTKSGMCIDNVEVSKYDKSAFASTDVGKFVNYYFVDTPTSSYHTDSNGTKIIQRFNNGYETSTAKFGKLSTDKSLHVFYKDTNAPANYNINPSSYIANGEILHISTMVAFSDKTTGSIEMYTTGSGQYNGFINVGVSGQTVSSFGKSLPSMNSNQWYRYDYIIYTDESGSRTADVYVNGMLQLDGVNFQNTDDLAAIRLQMTGSAQGDDGAYIDDTLVASYSSDLAPIIPSVTIINSNVTIEDADTIYVPETYTVSDFVTNTSASMPYEIRTKAGASVADNASLVGNYIVFKPAIGGEIYYEVKAARDAGYHFRNEFDRSNDDALTLTGGTSVIKDAGYGRSGNANYVTVGEGGTAKLLGSFYSKLATTADGTTVEMDILTPADTSSFVEPFVAWKDLTGYRRPLLRFGSDGNVQKVIYKDGVEAPVSITNTGFTWEPNRWYHVSAWLPNNYGEARVYLNGELVHNVSTVAKNVNLNVIGVIATGAASTFAVDNVRVFDGNYEVIADEDKVLYAYNLADNKKRVIYLPDDEYIDEFADVYFEDGTVIIYEDSSLSTQVEDLADYSLTGNEIIVVKSENGKATAYYTIKPQSEAEIFGIKQSNSDLFVTSNRVLTTDGNLSVYVYKDSGYIIAAQYSDDGEMVKLDTTLTAVNELTEIELDSDADIIKFMHFDSFDSIKPLKRVKVMDVVTAELK